MDFKLIWSESAIEDLGAIVRFIALRDGSHVARQTGFGIYDRAQILSKALSAPQAEQSRCSGPADRLPVHLVRHWQRASERHRRAEGRA